MKNKRMRHSRKIIPIAKPCVDKREAEAAARVILSGWLTQGPETALFEEEFARYVGAKHACAVSSCTTALHLAMLAAGVKPGDEVITVSHSFIATANAVRYCGATPVFIDIEPGTYNMDPRLIEKAVNKRTRAILCVHQMGMPCDLKAILNIAKKYSLPVIEDAACAIGSEILWKGKWEKIGKSHADIVCFSFHPRKIITCGDGGMITTAHKKWDKKLRLLRQHGMSVSDKARHDSGSVIFETYEFLGYNFRMTDIQAAVGREQLKKLPFIISRRRQLAKRYLKFFSRSKNIILPQEPSWARSNWQSFCIRLNKNVNRLSVMKLLLKAGISSRRGVMCAHKEPAYKTEPWSKGSKLNESELAVGHCIIIPLYPQMTFAQQNKVIKVLSHCVQKL